MSLSKLYIYLMPFPCIMFPGIEYTLGRVPIGSTDFSTRTYSYADVPNDLNLHWFTLAREDTMYKVSLINLIDIREPAPLYLIRLSHGFYKNYITLVFFVTIPVRVMN